MNQQFLLFMLSFTVWASTSRGADVTGRVTSYGIFKITGKMEIVESPQTPNGFTSIPANTPMLITATNRIPAKIGTLFGMWYELSNVPLKDFDQAEVVKIARHPAITKPDGTISKGFTFVEKQWVKDGRVVGWTGYGFEEAYELAVGIWEFEMQFEGRTVCKHEFRVFKE